MAAVTSPHIRVADQYLYALVPGTQIKVTTSKGSLSGQTNYTVPDAVGGPTEISVRLIDTNASAAETGVITVDVSSPEIVGCTVTKAGTLQ